MTGNHAILSDEGLDIIFRDAHTAHGWKDHEVSDSLLQALWDLMRWGPTSANSQPARIVFVKTPEAKEKLKPHLSKGNIEQSMSAPVTAIIAHDTRFYEHMDRLYPQSDYKSLFGGNQKLAAETAYRNGSLMGGYFIIAARALGMDCGPMSGFDKKGVNETFFPDGRYEVNFLCNIGYGKKPDGFHSRNPRLEFNEACKIL